MSELDKLAYHITQLLESQASLQRTNQQLENQVQALTMALDQNKNRIDTTEQDLQQLLALFKPAGQRNE